MAGKLTLVEKTVFLKSIDLLASIPTEALALLADHASEERAAAGEVLFNEGDEDRGTFLVVEGEVELRREGAVVRVIGPRMSHGELFLGEAGVHQYTGVARIPTLALNLERADVLEALIEFPEFGLAMVKAQALLIHKLTERVLEHEGAAPGHGDPAEGDGTIPALEVPPETRADAATKVGSEAGTRAVPRPDEIRRVGEGGG